jgi:hypothetical protein
MMRTSFSILCACALLSLYAHRAGVPALAQADETAQIAVLGEINAFRLANGVPPLARNAQLEDAALRHSRDMAGKGFVDTIGSDGTDSRARIEATGYAAWPGQRVWGESIYAGQVQFSDALAFFASDETQRVPLLSPRFREVGIGIASDGVRTYWTISYGSQPGVLPVFINEGDTVTGNRQVTVLLTQEEAVRDVFPGLFDQATEVRLSDVPEFERARWQPWTRRVAFTFDRQPGLKTLFVELRDGLGLTVTSSAQIRFDVQAPKSTVAPEALRAATAAPTSAATANPAPPVAQPSASTTPTVAVAAVAAHSTPTAIAVNQVAIALTPSPTALPAAVAPVSQAPVNSAAPSPVAHSITTWPEPVSTQQEAPGAPAATSSRLLRARDSSVLPNWLLCGALGAQALLIAWAALRFIRRN